MPRSLVVEVKWSAAGATRGQSTPMGRHIEVVHMRTYVSQDHVSKRDYLGTIMTSNRVVLDSSFM